MLAIVLYLLAVILLTLAAFGANTPRVHLGWLSLAITVFTYAVLPHLA